MHTMDCTVILSDATKKPNDKFTVKMFERVYFSIFSLKAPPIKT